MQQEQSAMHQQAMSTMAEAAQMIAQAVQLMNAPKTVQLETPTGVKTATIAPRLN